MSAPSSSEARLGTLLVVLAAASWGTWSLWFRPTGLSGATTAPWVFGCVALGSIPLALRERARRPAPLRWTRSLVAMLVGYAVFDALNAATFFSAMNVTTVAVAVLTHDLAPVLVALLAPRIDGTVVPRAGWAAAIALLGVAVLLEPWREGAFGGDVVLGATLGTISAVAYAANVFLGRKLTLAVGPATAIGTHAVLAALLLLPFAGREVLAIEAADLPYLAVAGLVPGIFAGLAFLVGTTKIGSARAAILAFLEPLVACIVGFVAFGERLGGSAVVGGVLILAAGLLVSRTPEDTKREPDESSLAHS